MREYGKKEYDSSQSFLHKRNDKKMKKIGVLTIVFLLLGASIATLQFNVSLPTNNNWSLRGHDVENQVINDDFSITQIDIKSILDALDYLIVQAKNNNFYLGKIDISSNIVISSEKHLIILGHGSHNSRNQYCIGNLLESDIKDLALNKEFVALLACSSSEVELDNKILLTFDGEITLSKAINEFLLISQWQKTEDFKPIENISLFDLDPGTGGGTSDYVATTFYDDDFYAYTYTHPTLGYCTWNLRSKTAITSFNEFLELYENNQVYFVGSGDFTIQTTKAYFWGIIRSTSTRNEYVKITCNLKSTTSGGIEYIYAYNFRLNDYYADSSESVLKLNPDDSMSILESNVLDNTRLTLLARVAGILGSMGTALFIAGLKMTFEKTVLGILITDSTVASLGAILMIIAVLICALILIAIFSTDSTYIIAIKVT